MSVLVKFEKMHGAGNDFVVIDARTGKFTLDDIRKKTPALCHRRTGIGADGVLVLGDSHDSDFSMHYFNADGSLAGMCGNGARCLTRYAVHAGFSRELTFRMGENIYRAEVHDEYVSIHFPVSPEPETMIIDNTTWCELNPGTEHVVAIDPEFEQTPDESLRAIGREIRNRTDLFPRGTNVNFANPVNQNRLNLVTYERGVEDLTLACGTGAIATAIGWDFIKHGVEGPPCEGPKTVNSVTDHHIQLDCPGGPLEVSFQAVHKGSKRTYSNIKLHGPAESVFQGEIEL